MTNLATAAVLYRAVVEIHQPAYTTVWGVERRATTETLHIGLVENLDDLASAVRAELNWLRDDATWTTTVQELSADWRTVTPPSAPEGSFRRDPFASNPA